MKRYTPVIIIEIIIAVAVIVLAVVTVIKQNKEGYKKLDERIADAIKEDILFAH